MMQINVRHRRHQHGAVYVRQRSCSSTLFCSRDVVECVSIFLLRHASYRWCGVPSGNWTALIPCGRSKSRAVFLPNRQLECPRGILSANCSVRHLPNRGEGQVEQHHIDVVPIFMYSICLRLIWIVPRTTGVKLRPSARTYPLPFRLAGPLSLGCAGVFAQKQQQAHPVSYWQRELC